MCNPNRQNPFPYGNPIIIGYRKNLQFSKIYDDEQIEREALIAHNDILMEIVAFWTSAHKKVDFVDYSELINRGIVSIGSPVSPNSPTGREKSVCDNHYFTSLIWLTPGFNIDRVAANRPVIAQSIEEVAALAFEAQLAKTFDVFCKVFAKNPKTDGATIRDALYYHIKIGLQQNNVTGHSDESGAAGEMEDATRERGNEQIRRFSNRGRKFLAKLGATTADVGMPVPDKTFSFRATDDLLHAGLSDVEMLEKEKNETIRTEMAILLSLSRIRNLARRLHQAHLDIRRDQEVQQTRGQPPHDIVDRVSHPQFAVNTLVEEPARQLQILTRIAELAYWKNGQDHSRALLWLATDIALRYEVDILQLFPTRGVWRSMPQAACAVAAYNRRGELPDGNTFTGVCAYWGLRALLDKHSTVEDDRRPLRNIISRSSESLLPDALRDYALGESPAPLGIEAAERFRN
ncbi:hypothetical protein [Aurantimonas sp. NFXS3]|uniref:hypothetical protein n=1 Tax=Aurantimonas sp. NFXS3 TaxID=2818434 RepID=UPI003B8AE41C